MCIYIYNENLSIGKCKKKIKRKELRVEFDKNRIIKKRINIKIETKKCYLP